MAFKSNTHNVSQSSLAEVAQASIKDDEDKSVSLVDATYCDVAESTRSEGKMAKSNEWQVIRCSWA